MLEKYKTVYEGGEGEIVEKKSRFIAILLLVVCCGVTGVSIRETSA